MTLTRLFFVATFVAILTVTPMAQASVFSLSAVQDTFLDETTDKDSTHDDEGISIRRNSPRHVSLFQFDLSNLDGNITSAHLELYDLGTGGTAAFSTDFYFLTPDPNATDAELVVLNANNDVAFDKDGMHEEYASYNSYAAAGSSYWTESEAVIPMSIDADNLVGYQESDVADVIQLALLNENMNGRGFVVFLGWRTGNDRLFDDREGGHAPLLVLETDGVTVPEPTTITLLIGLGLGGVMVWFRRRK